jgi:excisionase family DNA binding protein
VPITEPPDLLGTTEAAAELGLERSTLARWVQLGKLTPAVKLPGPTGAMLFRRSDIDALRDEAAQARRRPPEAS